jgi:hypothetical protein
MRALQLVAAVAAVLVHACHPTPKTVLSTATIRTQRARTIEELTREVKVSGYVCKEVPGQTSIVLGCEDATHAQIAVEIRADTDFVALSVRYWLPNPRCGDMELTAEMESFNLDDRAGGTKVYCLGKKMVLEFETLLPNAGVEVNEVGTLVTRWIDTATSLVQNSVLLGESGEGSVQE